MIVSLVLAASFSSCGIEDGRYQLRGNPTVTAQFYEVDRTSDWRTGLALRIHARKTGRSYWFLPWQGGTDGRTNLAWTRERRSAIQLQSVRRDIEFFTADAAYNLDAEVPQSGGTAPMHLLLPNLGHLAWYSTTSMERDSIARAFFDLTDCVAAGPGGMRPDIEFPPVP